MFQFHDGMENISEATVSMHAALDQAHTAASLGETPVGAVIVHKGNIIAQAHNLTESRCDGTAHAELLVLRAASEALGSRYLDQCTLYVTLEPCAMCAAAMSHARLGKLVFGAYDAKGGAVEHGSRWFTQPTCHHAPEWHGGVREAECGALLKEFFSGLR